MPWESGLGHAEEGRRGQQRNSTSDTEGESSRQVPGRGGLQDRETSCSLGAVSGGHPVQEEGGRKGAGTSWASKEAWDLETCVREEIRGGGGGAAQRANKSSMVTGGMREHHGHVGATA